MKRTTKAVGIFLLAAFISFTGSLILPRSSRAVNLSFEPFETEAQVGSPLSVDLMVSGLDRTNLAGFDLTVDFDETVLSFMDYALGDGLGSLVEDASDWSNGFLGSGQIHLSEMSWLWDFGFQSDSFSLATLTFEGITEGLSMLSLSDVVLSDDWGDQIFAELTDGSVNITSASTVPEPASMFLLGAGLILAGGLNRGRKKEKK